MPCPAFAAIAITTPDRPATARSVARVTACATGAAKALTGPEMLLEVLGTSAGSHTQPADESDARVRDALASSPAGPDSLG